MLVLSSVLRPLYSMLIRIKHRKVGTCKDYAKQNIFIANKHVSNKLKTK